MTWIDLLPIALVIVYGVGGFFTGVVRRLIGLIALYVAIWAATNMGQQAGGILQQSGAAEATADARIYGFFGIVVAFLVIIEVATQLAHSQIQLPGLLFNRAFGAFVGVVTAIMLSFVVVYELGQAANPFGGPQLTTLEQRVRDAVHGSLFMVKLTNSVGRPIVGLFSPVLPGDGQIYFGPGPISS
ncbi:MAG TPA: CvpA family protein [Candidatus Dormibacteraeota bacterium]|nr:CvpA family protein [Candidatus Dormibacteraeota bacterium]